MLVVATIQPVPSGEHQCVSVGPSHSTATARHDPLLRGRRPPRHTSQLRLPFVEILRSPRLSLGLYRVERASPDPQPPHGEDEVYVVLSGAGEITVNGVNSPVRQGSVIFVPAGAQHSFRSVDHDIEVLAVFAPAFGSQAHD